MGETQAMAKRKPKRRERREPEVAEYADADGNVLTLRKSLSAGTIRKIRRGESRPATSLDDEWQRRTELLFERLATRWEIAGLPIDEQAMLLGRYRMADADERRWVRETIDAHIADHIPELRPG
jgi:hypothetical protein